VLENRYLSSLGTKITTLVAIITVVVILAVVTVFVLEQTQKISGYHLESGKTFAEFLTPVIYDAYVSSPTRGQLSFLELVREQIQKNSDIVNVMMVSQTGKIFFDTDDAVRGIQIGRNETTDRFVSDEVTLQMIVAGGIAHRGITLPDGTDGAEVVIPVYEASGVHIFSMRYIFSFASVKDQLRKVYTNIGTVMLPLLLIIIFISIFFSRSISKPLKNLTALVGEVAKGRLDITIDSKSRDEVGLLSRAFSSMTRDLKRSHEEVVAYQKSIEAKVEERTRELDASKKDLEVKIDELERMNKIMVDRELKMIELKKENENLKKEVLAKIT
jgi:methyl-accepting chemotaxis protein